MDSESPLQVPPPAPPAARRRTTALRVFLLLAVIYGFLLSIKMMSSGLGLIAEDPGNKKAIEDFIEAFSSNRVVALFLGVVITAVFQSSSFTTSLVVALVYQGTLSVEQAIPIVMGANVGTTITNTLVSLGHLSRRDEFRRAFSGAVVHDIFNLLTVAVLFPIEMVFRPLEKLARVLAPAAATAPGAEVPGLLHYICAPLIGWIKAFFGWCGLAPTAAGILVTVLAAALLFVSLIYTVKLLKRLVLVRVERFFDRVLFRNGLTGFLVGLVLTFVVQSSSVATSMVVPLLGAGVLTLGQIFPYTVGSNIGTTIKMMLIALASGNPYCVQIAWVHLIFNCVGGAIFWPLKAIPIRIAAYLGRKVEKNRAYAAVHLVVVFVIIPAIAITLGHFIGAVLGGQ